MPTVVDRARSGAKDVMAKHSATRHSTNAPPSMASSCTSSNASKPRPLSAAST